jgi:hypothetical protein
VPFLELSSNKYAKSVVVDKVHLADSPNPKAILQNAQNPGLKAFKEMEFVE